MPEQHYNISPSQLYRWLACDASFQEERKYPDKPGGPAAIDGTHSHTLLEHCAKNDLSDPMFMVGEKLEDHEGEFIVDVDRALRVKKAIDYLKQRKQELKQCAMRFEEVSDPGAYCGWDDWKGTCDATIVGNTELEVIDYKDGRSPQSPINNSQLMSYALGRLMEYQALPSALPSQFERVRLTIIQPRVSPIISHSDLLPEEFLNFAGRVEQWRQRAEAPDPEFNPGDKQCKWCNARSGCAAFINESLEGVAMQFQNLEIANQAADKEPSEMSDEKLREFMEGIPLLKQAIAAVEEEALRRFETGHKVPGLKAVRGRGSRQYAQEDDEMAKVFKKMGVPKSAMYETKLVSPAKAEKMQWEKRDGTKHMLSERQVATLNSEYIKRTPGKITIVPESDEREEVMLGAEALFSAVEPQETELPTALQF